MRPAAKTTTAGSAAQGESRSENAERIKKLQRTRAGARNPRLKKKQSRGFAITGIVTGAISIVIGLGLILFALAFVGALFSGL